MDREGAHARQAAVYVRVSTQDQADEGTSLDTQLDACRAYAEEHGLQVLDQHVYRETYSGAELWDRPELTRLRDAMRDSQFSVVIFYSSDRLTRDTDHFAYIAVEADRYSVELESVTEDLEKGPLASLIRTARGFAAAMEREKIKERSLRGKLARLRSGKVQNHGRELYGYRRNRKAGTRTVYEPEAVVVRQVFNWLAESVPLREVVRRLSEQNIPSPSGNPKWARSQVHRMAANPAYKGEAVAWRYKRVRRNGRHAIVMRDEAEWVALTDTTPAIVPPALWQKVQDRFSNNAGESTRNSTRPYLLRGMVFCAVCGNRMYAMSEKGTRIYRCSSRDKGGHCGGSRVRAADLEPEVWARVVQVLLNPDTIAESLERQANGHDDESATRRDALLSSIAKIERQQKSLVAKFGEVDEPGLVAQLRERWAELEQDRVRLTEEVAALDRRAEEANSALIRLEALNDYCARMVKGLGLDELGRVSIRMRLTFEAEGIPAIAFVEKRKTLETLSVKVRANGRKALEVSGLISLFEDGEQSPSC